MTTESQLQQSDQLVLFRVANEELAISIHAVQEIIRPPLITRVPRAPQYVDGMGNLRGEILPIINLRLFLGLSAKENDEQTRIVVVNVNGAITGIVVDSVSEVLTIDRRILEAPPATARNVNGEFLKNIAKAENGKRLILILDETRLQVDEHLAPLAAAEAGSSLATVHAADHAGQEQSEIEQLVTFQISHEEYALPIMQVKEIIKLVDIVPVPNAPEYVLGVISLRDHLLPIIDLKLRFRKRSKADATEASDESKRIVVVYIDGERTGILVDSVSQVLRLEKNKVDAPPNLIKQDGVDCHGNDARYRDR
jgi:purine-binding chemotaxis protein CheW